MGHEGKHVLSFDPYVSTNSYQQDPHFSETIRNKLLVCITVQVQLNETKSR